MKTRIVATCLLLTLVFTAHLHAQAVRTIFLVRHADKVDDSPDALLSDTGHRRAQCLAKMLADADIHQIYTSDLQRTQQTAAPLARLRQLKPVAVPLRTPDALIEALKSEKASNVLVVWHGGTLPRVLHSLGAPEVPPIADAEYDRFYILTPGQNKERPIVGFTVLRYCDRDE